MDIKDAQSIVDEWIKTVGVRYFNELTNTAILMEEVGEVAMEQPELLKRTNKQYKKDVKIWQGGQLPYKYMEKEY